MTDSVNFFEPTLISGGSARAAAGQARAASSIHQHFCVGCIALLLPSPPKRGGGAGGEGVLPPTTPSPPAPLSRFGGEGGRTSSSQARLMTGPPAAVPGRAGRG